ncbi:mitochondrial fission 1 protein-like [Planococcus citri]|uniref:mitochondrial fission 1 protein-like n=1 Tax=Planococcus citri TaxID=170843 RepID=UPI0031FA2FF2
MDNEILNRTIRIDVLKEFENRYFRELSKSNVQSATVFNYASCLVQSSYAADIHKGISLFMQLIESSQSRDFSIMDCAYFIALGKARIKDYTSALHYTGVILKIEPNNLLVSNLQDNIKKNKKKDELKKVAVSGGLAVTIGGIFGLGLTLARML